MGSPHLPGQQAPQTPATGTRRAEPCHQIHRERREAGPSPAGSGVVAAACPREPNWRSVATHCRRASSMMPARVPGPLHRTPGLRCLAWSRPLGLAGGWDLGPRRRTHASAGAAGHGANLSFRGVPRFPCAQTFGHPNSGRHLKNGPVPLLDHAQLPKQALEQAAKSGRTIVSDQGTPSVTTRCTWADSAVGVSV